MKTIKVIIHLKFHYNHVTVHRSTIVSFYNVFTMGAIKLELLLFLNILYVTDGVRRITDGKKVEADKKYVVYLVKAPKSIRIYDEWLCGGALVSKWFIITSAACVADVEYMYAIAGYSHYVRDDEIEVNRCTKEMKKKVIYTCVPRKYELDYHKVEKWSFIDIALAKVESEYDLGDVKFNYFCSYTPAVININFDQKFQKPGTDTLVYGWGHATHWRQQDKTDNLNQKEMQYAAAKIIDKTECKRHYEKYANMNELIDNYMICTLNHGEFNDKGDFLMSGDEPPKLQGCSKKRLLNNNSVILNGEIVRSPNTSVTNDGLVCEDDNTTYKDILSDITRRGDGKTNQTSSDWLQNKNTTVFNRTTARKHGICQNDHGGPLVTWVGGNEILIGVASVFRVEDDLRCNGPYLYTSTQCNGAFIHCILNNSSTKSRRDLCDSPPIQRGYDTVERYISWEDYPTGPADNERNSNSEHEKETRDVKSIGELQRLLRFNMLVKMGKLIDGNFTTGAGAPTRLVKVL